LEPSKLFNDARRYNLLIHPYTFRSDLDPQPFATFNVMLEFFIDRLKIDGLFIDQPDKAVEYIRSKQQPINQGTRLENIPFGFIILSMIMIK
jgi:glycerophosphoryl diester phosphodiesterase